MRSLIKFIRKFQDYLIAFIELFRITGYNYRVKRNPGILIDKLNKLGASIAKDVILFSPETLNIDLTRPTLIKIGGNTFIHRNFTILTHDYATSVFLNLYKEFIPSSGTVLIGKNVWFGMNVTCLKGTDIGDNCIIGYGSVVMTKIPPNSVAAGCPAKVICTLEQYFEKRKEQCIDEAFEYAKSIQERLNRRPLPSDFWEEFPLFVTGSEVDEYPEIPIEKQMKQAFDYYKDKHHARFKSFDDFLAAAGL